MFRRFILASLTIATALATAGSAQTNSPIGGRWRTDDNNAIVTIAPCTVRSATMCGSITQLLNPTLARARDGNNPNAALRTRPILGLQMFSGLTRDGATWTGPGYSPQDGRNFNATVTPHGNQLRVRGCVAIFCRTVEWARVS
ncbi:MAG: DUF2147 domain-containing protein [Sphingopyxis sp.]